jgi:hypothetical protein
LRNGWIRKFLPSKYRVPGPGAILFEANEHVQTMKPSYPPTLNRVAFLVGRQPMNATSVSVIAPNSAFSSIPKDPVHMTTRSSALSKKKAGLRARLNIGGKFIKDVATTVTAKNEVSLYRRLQNVLADYGKVNSLRFFAIYHRHILPLTGNFQRHRWP